jgi:cytochrome b561
MSSIDNVTCLPPPRAERYGNVAIALHWLIALLLGLQLALGWWMTGLPKTPPGLRAGWFNLHKSVGITLGLLILLRLWWRWRHAPPPWPTILPRWQRLAANTTHRALYGAMVLMPLSGYLGSNFTRYPIRLFGMPLPRWGHDWPAGKAAMSAVHDWTAWILLALLALHLAGAFAHMLRRDRVLVRMLPRRRAARLRAARDG